MRRLPRITVVCECPCADLCAGYDRDTCPLADVVGEVPYTVLVCPSGTWDLEREDGMPGGDNVRD